MAGKKYDILLYGATGFTGLLTAKYLDALPSLAGKSWAIAGRTKAKLEALKADLRSGPDIVCCILDNESAVEKMVCECRVIITCAGPYSMQNGQALLGACARAGVHYSDLAGEGFWQREMIDQFSSVAKSMGAKIVLGGGVDSIPSDLGVDMALAALPAEPGQRITVQGVYTEYTGAFSGGTLNSGRAVAAAQREGRLTEQMNSNPYLLAPELGEGFDGPDTAVGTHSGMPNNFQRSWFSNGYLMLSDFFMAAVNARIVRRSLALKGRAEDVSYSECCTLGMWARIGAKWMSRGFGYFVGEPIKFKPESGEGPPSWLLKCGSFTLEVTATNDSTGSSSTVVVRGKGDPGYGATSKMLAETGLCLAFDDLGTAPAEGAAGGVLTPATALGDLLVRRLCSAEEGDFMSFDVSGGSSKL